MSNNSDVKIVAEQNIKAIGQGNAVINNIKSNIRQFIMVFVLLIIFLVFTILTQGTFISFRNLSNLLMQGCTIAILGLGMVLVMVAGHIDLSVGSFVGFTGAIAAALQVKMHFGTIPAILVTLIVGIVIGVWHGYWVAYRDVPAFIVTLASMLALRGGALGVTGGNSIGPTNPSFKAIGQGFVPKLFFKDANFSDTSIIIGIVFIILFIIYDLRKRRSRIKYGFKVPSAKMELLKIVGTSVLIAAVMLIMITYMGVPYAILLLIALTVLFTFIAQNTTFGRHVYAIGGNREAAKLSGVNIRKTNMIIFILMGLLSAIAGIVFTGRLNTATPAAGTNFELNAIAGCVIGGTSTLGGEGTIVGAIIGTILMASLDNGMSLMNVNVTYQYIVKGLVLLFAVAIDIASRKKAA